MAKTDPVWFPLVDEPIGSIVTQIQQDDPEIDRLVSSPNRILAFRTFAYIRVGVLLGRLLVESDLPEYDGTETWVETLLRDPANRAAVAREVRTVAEEVAAESAPDEPVGPDPAARERFRALARSRHP
jgi:hypothetical protein